MWGRKGPFNAQKELPGAPSPEHVALILGAPASALPLLKAQQTFLMRVPVSASGTQ